MTRARQPQDIMGRRRIWTLIALAGSGGLAGASGASGAQAAASTGLAPVDMLLSRAS